MNIDKIQVNVNMINGDALDILEDSNQPLSEQSLFEYRGDGFEDVVLFLGIRIWESEDDRRDYIGDTDFHEPLYDYLAREANKVVDMIKQLKFSY